MNKSDKSLVGDGERESITWWVTGWVIILSEPLIQADVGLIFLSTFVYTTFAVAQSWLVHFRKGGPRCELRCTISSTQAIIFPRSVKWEVSCSNSFDLPSRVVRWCVSERNKTRSRLERSEHSTERFTIQAFSLHDIPITDNQIIAKLGFWMKLVQLKQTKLYFPNQMCSNSCV